MRSYLVSVFGSSKILLRYKNLEREVQAFFDDSLEVVVYLCQRVGSDDNRSELLSLILLFAFHAELERISGFGFLVILAKMFVSVAFIVFLRGFEPGLCVGDRVPQSLVLFLLEMYQSGEDRFRYIVIYRGLGPRED